MKKRDGLMSIAVAIIILLFSIVAAMVISNISSNLYKNIIKMDEGKELQYRRIVIMSLKNGTDYFVNEFHYATIEAATTTSLIFNFSGIDFPATATLAASNVTTKEATFAFFELYTKPPGLDTYGIVVQYKK